jgi:hypothetical protein
LKLFHWNLLRISELSNKPYKKLASVCTNGKAVDKVVAIQDEVVQKSPLAGQSLSQIIN